MFVMVNTFEEVTLGGTRGGDNDAQWHALLGAGQHKLCITDLMIIWISLLARRLHKVANCLNRPRAKQESPMYRA